VDHSQRHLLHNEIHARPPEALRAPLRIKHLVMWINADSVQKSRNKLNELLQNFQHSKAPEQVNHFRTELQSLKFRWQLHTEFVSWTWIQPIDAKSDNFDFASNLEHDLPAQFIMNLPGECLCNIELLVINQTTADTTSCPIPNAFNESTLVGSNVAASQAQVFTDFQLRQEGEMRMLLVNQGLSPRRLGRLVQQLLEVETYRMAALLGLPAARATSSALGNAEKELAELARAIRSATTQDEAVLLDRLTRLAGEVEEQYAATHSRFSATRAYYELIDRRIRDMGETALPGLQTLGVFLDRRLSPARSTCESATQRQDALSVRVSRISNLLRTRVDFEQQQSAQELLTTMNIRQDIQVRLQTTVEGLSVAAITYYITGLIGYIVKGAHLAGWPYSTEATIACVVPFVALLVWWFMRRLHQHLLHSTK
jgi:uncharacterized membrane-anchored protein